MGSEIAVRQEAGQVMRGVVDRDVVDGWIGAMEPVARLAESIAHTEFVPSGLRGKPAAITAAILYGREIGLGPIQSLQSVDVIEGRPAISAEMARALALAAGHEIHVEESTTQRCVVRGRRANSREWVSVTWTMDDAKRAGLDGRKNWRMHPRRMLQARATAELCHLLFADAIGGMPFTLEEVVDDSDAAGQVGEGAAKPARRTARRSTPVRDRAEDKPSGHDAGAPPLPGDEETTDVAKAADEPDVVDGQAEEGEPAITDAQIRKLNATLRELGVEARNRRLEVTTTLVGRPIGSSKDLTKAEAGTLLDTLERVSSGPDPSLRLVELVEQTQQAAAATGTASDAPHPREDPPDGPAPAPPAEPIAGQEALPT